MRAFIIILAIALSSQRCFALTMTPRIPQANASAPVRLTSAPVSVPARVAQKVSASEKALLARVTVYWASGGKGSDRDTRQHKTATGCRLRSGHCAVDPRHIPYGSEVVLADGTKLAAVDTGTAVRTRKAARQAGRTPEEKSAVVIDRFFETKGQALAWAKTHPLFMPIRVQTPKNSTATQTDTTTRTYTLASNRSAAATQSLNRSRN